MSSDTKSTDSGPDERVIEARGLGKVYSLYDRPQDRLKQMLWPRARRAGRKFAAVRGVDLDVGRGECVGVVGRNGSGKSTLLSMICGTLEPSEGELEVRGRVAPMLAIGAGFSPEFTGRENVRLNAAVLGYSDRDLSERMQRIIDFADIGEFFDQPVKRYSAGMYSRIAFAAAIAIDPEILIMDEVLAVGDEAFTRKCFARIESIREAGATIFFASHAPNLILELCDRAILMDAGECLLQADPKTVIAQHHRLMFSPKEDFEAIRGEVRRIGELPARERATAGASRTRATAAAPEEYGRYDAGLKPETTLEYGDGRARIVDVRILDPEDRPVNVLRAGRSYRYAYEVEFREDVWGVRFGMLVKLTTGFELAGQASDAPGAGLEKVAVGSSASVEFPFVARLAPGTYFANAGVLGQGVEGETYLHRVVDALMFKVLPGDSETVTGSVDLRGEEGARVRLDHDS
ncbi:MAG: ABC transporter ATP-binding protein [Deltaproteobacteria bacterium]|nr:ABC transporter ATP-binding protein [Deltaproteobacteria bacterium]